MNEAGMPSLVKIQDLQLDPSNPRETDPVRLALVEESLRKLGFILPMFATADGLILSGHQRLLAAQNIGARQVPVIYLDRKSSEIAQVNYLFNRVTNDMTVFEGAKEVSVAADWPDVVIDSPAFFRCMQMRSVDAAVIQKWLGDFESGDLIGVAKQAWTQWRITQPLVVSDGQIINGKGRAAFAVLKGLKAWPVVEIEPHEAIYAGEMLNNLSMDYRFDKTLADRLRYSARRLSNSVERYQINTLRHAFTFALGQNIPFFDVLRIEHARRWTRQYGTTVLDFGAGQGNSLPLLRQIGVDVSLFEPYVVIKIGTQALPEREPSVQSVTTFLERVRNTRWTSIFLSAVLQAIPFRQDRQHVVQLLAALCGDGVIYARGKNAQAVRQGITRLGKTRPVFLTPIEKGAAPSTVSGFTFKTQAALQHRDFAELFAPLFNSVRLRQDHGHTAVIARDPKPIDHDALRAAIEFEFDLPYPDGTRMGLTTIAKAAFTERLNDGVVL